jgi:predicted Zn-dependent protease
MTVDIDTLIATLEDSATDENFETAKNALEALLAEKEQAKLVHYYGYIHECRGRGLIREAIRWYERALGLDPTYEKVRHQLIQAYASLHETQAAIELYKLRLAETPGEIAEYRFLAHAYLAAGAYEEAGEVVTAGLELAPDDPGLLLQQGSVLEGKGRFDEALASWDRVREVAPDWGDPLYSRCFLLERIGRLPEAVDAWETLISWQEERGYEIDARWPKRELARLRAKLASA